jgi:prepilin-type N-terminal cleavage/methylation domain-containing protein
MLPGQNERKGESKMNCVSLKKQKGATKMKRGFTLIELMIVMAVIAILVGIALPQFRGMQEEGLIAQAKAELMTLKTAVESYYIHTGAYPADSATWQSVLITASPIIVRAALIDPFTASTQYQIVYSASPGEYYAIYSVGTSGSALVSLVSAAGVVTESASTCIYVSNGEEDVDS